MPHGIILIACRSHLKKAHTQAGSLVYCRRCLCSFENTNKLEDHCQAPVACKPSRLTPNSNGIQENQWEEIDCVFSGHKGKKRVDDDSRWLELWRIILPGMIEPSSTREYNTGYLMCKNLINLGMEKPGYIARTSYGMDELRFEFEHRIEEGLQNGSLHRDAQIQRLSHIFEQTLEACSATLGSMQLASPGDGGEYQRSISSPVQSKHKDIEDICLTRKNDAGQSSSTSRRTSRLQGSQEGMKESSLEDYTQLKSAPSSSKASLAQKKYHSLGIDDVLPESTLSPFCEDDIESDAAYYLAQSALSQATPRPEDDSYC